VLEHVEKVQLSCWNTYGNVQPKKHRKKSDLGVRTCWTSLTKVLEHVEKVRHAIGDILHQLGRLVLRHPVQISKYGDSFFAVHASGSSI
jgi:hypothetical protein